MCTAFGYSVLQITCGVTKWPLSTNKFSHVSFKAAKLPMSIIIVGVGQAEFDGKY